MASGLRSPREIIQRRMKSWLAMTAQALPKHAEHVSPTHEPPAAVRATGIVVLLAVVIAIVSIAFALPAARSKPHDVPIGAAGPQAASGQIADILEQNAP